MSVRRTSDEIGAGRPDRSGRSAGPSTRAPGTCRGRRRRRRSGALATRGRSDRWLISYADFITLLFAFFTTLYAASSVDAIRAGRMMDSMQRAFDAPGAARQAGGRVEPTGSTPGEAPLAAIGAHRPVAPVTPVVMEAIDASAMPPSAPLDSVPLGVVPIAIPTTGSSAGARAALGPARPADPDSLRDVRARLAERLAAELETGQVAIEMDRRGLVVSIREAGSFAVGSAALSPSAARIMARLAATLAEVANPIRIEGHTDDVPIHTPRFGSNWELSTARAVEVVAFLVQGVGLDPDRLSAAGYSEYRPRFSNATAAGRARNRRVDLVVLNPETARTEEPAGLEATP